MPYVEILWRPEALAEERLIGVREAIVDAVADCLTAFDPEHEVTAQMVDVRVTPVGSLDVLNSELLVTVMARYEDARSDHAYQIAVALAAVAVEAGAPRDTMVELVLNHRTSGYDYAARINS